MNQPAPLPAALQSDYDRWLERKKAALNDGEPTEDPFVSARDQLKAALASLPESVSVPYEMTPEGERMAAFKRICPPEFLCKVDRSRLPNPAAFDRVAHWDGSFPGPCAHGPTSTAKTRAAWSVIGRLYVKQNLPFAWFPVRRLATELERYENNGAADEFFRAYSHYRTLLIDDADKINWQFDSHKEQLFAFADWLYRTRKPCVITTNKGRKWWTDKMGDAFTRRIFDDACFEVNFTQPNVTQTEIRT